MNNAKGGEIKGRRVLFIDRDGTLIREYPPDYQIDSWDKLEFYPFAFTYMHKIAAELDFHLVMVSNQDGLGTEKFPEENFHAIHNHIIRSFENEGVTFAEIHIDRSMPDDNLDTRKPGIGMLKGYLNNSEFDIPNSFVIGDRITDVQMAKNVGCRAIWLKNNPTLGSTELKSAEDLEKYVALSTTNWADIYTFLRSVS